MIKKRITFLVVTLLVCCKLFAQDGILVKGNIMDKSGDAVPYASILAGKGIGTNADIEGYFELVVKNIPAQIEISSIGYHGKTVIIDKPQSMTIVLKPRSIQLEDLKISGEKIEPLILGCEKRRKGITEYSVEGAFWQIGLMVNNKGGKLYSEERLLKSISISISSPWNKGDPEPNGTRQLRLRLYKTDSGKIGDDFLHESWYFEPKKVGWYKFTIPKKITLPMDGFVVAVEWVPNQKTNVTKHKGKGYEFEQKVYGLGIKGHNLKKDELHSYSSWVYRTDNREWIQWKSKDFHGEKYVIPAFRIETY